MRTSQLEPISEAAVTATAQILGPNSATAQALKDAERRRVAGETVEFFRAGNSIVVRGTAPTANQSGAMAKQGTVRAEPG